MSLLKSIADLTGRTKTLSIGSAPYFNQVRNATKRAAGSRTNKNDTAGRRLGPKVHEGNFVKPGQIIMRQRGTKIHPGENTDIGRDHTIFAMEPGYVRFYYDPFHPLRKYVGVSLTRDLPLPHPHFAPRSRRFGYEQIVEPEAAKQEEDHMSRKEYLQTPELKQKAEELEELLNSKRAEFKTEISNKLGEPTEDILDSIVERMVNIYQLSRVGQSIEEAQAQATFNYIYDLKLKLKRGEIKDAESFNSLKEHYLNNVANATNSKLAVDSTGTIFDYLTPEQVQTKQVEIIQKLEKDFTGKIIKLEEKRSILNLIETPGIFTKERQAELKQVFLPRVLPVTVPGTVTEDFDAKKPGKGVTVVRIFDDKTKEVKTYGRTQNAFVPQE